MYTPYIISDPLEYDLAVARFGMHLAAARGDLEAFGKWFKFKQETERKIGERQKKRPQASASSCG